MNVGAPDSIDADGFQALVAPHLVMMRRLAIRLTSAAAADRIVNRALRRAWRDRTARPVSDSTQTWLLAIVANRARRYRSRDQGAATELIDVADGVIELDLDQRMDIDGDIASLPWGERLAIELVYVIGLTAEECAAVMACSAADVSALLVEARRQLLGEAQQVDLW